MLEKQTVHALIEGLPLCQFSTEAPANWPPGHVWTYVEDVDNLNCPSCRSQAEEMPTTKNEQNYKLDYKSKCCDAEVRTEGIPDFIGGDEVCTVSFVCIKCNKGCDIKK